MMTKTWIALAAASCALSASAQAQTSTQAFTTTLIEPDPIETVVGDSGYVPESLVAPAATLLANIANQYQAAIVGALNGTQPLPLKLTNPELYYSYGKSPPVYPSPEGTGEGEWAAAYKKAKALVSKMTIEEKNNITVPAANADGSSAFQGCAGLTGSVPRLNYPGICLQDAENGLRLTNPLMFPSNVTGFPTLLSVGASFNRGLAWWRANYLGQEFKTKGANVVLGPVVGPLGRVTKGGRNWEGFSNDPYLAGSLVEQTVLGTQKHAVACVKHFIANEQEANRNPFVQGLLEPIGIHLNGSVSANIDDKTIHELYLWPFYDAVKAGAGSIMASYQRVNNSYASQNSKILNGLLKTELGFQGFVVSDWFGQHTGVASAKAGLDMVMPSGLYWDKKLSAAVRNGSLSASRLDDMATRIVAAWYRYAPLEKPAIANYDTVDARNPESSSTILQAAVEGHVLVKNVKKALPLHKPKTLSIFGWNAVSGYNDSKADANLYGLQLSNSQLYTDGSAFGGINLLLLSAAIQNGYYPEVAFNGTMLSGGGSGAVTPSESVSPFDALKRQASIDGTKLYTDFVSQNPTVKASDACLVLLNAQAAEGADRRTLADEYSDTLVTNVASKCKNTIVVIHNAGIRLVDRWIDHENVTAAMFAHLPGQASGDALVEVLYGRQSPSGRLPYTVAKRESDYGAVLDPTLPTEEDPQYSQSNFDEGVFIDYRAFVKKGIKPRFAFGYGLTYSEFSYSNLHVAPRRGVNTSPMPPDASKKPPSGGHASLYDIVADASVTVKNTGKVAAAEVAQLYIGIPNSGVKKALRGFDKKSLKPGASATFKFPLRRRDLSNWDTASQQWLLEAGSYKVYAGKSVADTPLKASFKLAGNRPPSYKPPPPPPTYSKPHMQ